MNAKNYIGGLVCIVGFVAVFAFSDGAATYVNLTGLLIVMAGTLGATLLSFPIDDLRAAVKVAIRSYTVRTPTAYEIVDTLLHISIKSRKSGIFALRDEERGTEINFLKDALGMMVDGFDKEQLNDILTTESHFFKRRRERHERVFRHMARLAPAFGVTGSVIGLIGMLAGIGDTTVILQTIPIALTSTLYGIVLCNLVLIPIAECIHAKTERELLMQRLVIEGVFAILELQNSHLLERRLTSFLTPALRASKVMSFREIRNRHLEAQLEDEPAT